MTRGVSADRPTQGEVLAALDRVLRSPAFETAGRARDFLAFIVRETLADRGDRLKGYTIAVEVFKRPPDFDAQTDPLVRVEAGRLRRRLAEYYHGAGRGDALRIDLPRGGYTPVFMPHSPPAAVEARAATRAPVARRRTLAWAAGAVALLVAALATGFWRVSTTSDRAVEPGEPDPGTPLALESPRVVVLPIETFGEGVSAGFAHALTDEIIHSMVAFEFFATASPATYPGGEARALASLRRDFNARYALSGTVRTDNGRARVVLRLTDTTLGTQIWTSTFDEDLVGGEVSVPEAIGQAVGKTLSSPYGPMFAHDTQLIASKPNEDLDAYECLLRFYDYTRTFDSKAYGPTLDCMQRVVATHPTFAPGWGALANLYLQGYIFGYDSGANRTPALDRAAEAAQRALDLFPAMRNALIAKTSLEHLRGNDLVFNEMLAKVSATEPVLPAMMGPLGLILALSGDGSRSDALVGIAETYAYRAPTWYNTVRAFNALQAGQYDDALQWAQKVNAPNWFIGPMTLVAAAELAGRHDIAEREVERLHQLQPNFSAMGPVLLRRWRVNDKLLGVLFDGLRRAGVDLGG